MLKRNYRKQPLHAAMVWAITQSRTFSTVLSSPRHSIFRKSQKKMTEMREKSELLKVIGRFENGDVAATPIDGLLRHFRPELERRIAEHANTLQEAAE